MLLKYGAFTSSNHAECTLHWIRASGGCGWHVPTPTAQLQQQENSHILKCRWETKNNSRPTREPKCSTEARAGTEHRCTPRPPAKPAAAKEGRGEKELFCTWLSMEQQPQGPLIAYGSQVGPAGCWAAGRVWAQCACSIHLARPGLRRTKPCALGRGWGSPEGGRGAAPTSPGPTGSSSLLRPPGSILMLPL